MQWFGRGSENIEDRRGMRGGGIKIGGGIGILVVIIGLFFGKDLYTRHIGTKNVLV